MAEGTLCILEMRSDLHCKGSAAEVLRIRGVAEEVLRDVLPRALGQAVARGLGGDEVAVIDRLEVGVSLDPDEDPALTAERWAAAILKGLRRALQAPDRYYRDRAEHLACYIEATLTRTRGAADFRAFAGFAAMPPGMAIRAALCQEGACAHDALRRLSPRSHARLLAALSEPDARLILRAVCSSAPMPGVVRLGVSAKTLDAAAATRAPDLAALCLVLSGMRAEATGTGPVSAKTVRAFAGAVLRAYGAARAAVEPTGSMPAEDAGLLPEGLRAILSDQIGAVERGAVEARPLVSQAAGLALLLPTLLSVGDGTAAVQRSGTAARLRLDLLVAASQGRADLADPLLRTLAGAPLDGRLDDPDPGLAADLARALELAQSEPLDLAEALARRFALGVRGFETTSAEFILENFLSGAGSLTRKKGVLTLRYAPPPIYIALRLSGVERVRVQPPWLAGLTVDIAPEAPQ